jgi:hypothetical protein
LLSIDHALGLLSQIEESRCFLKQAAQHLFAHKKMFFCSAPQSLMSGLVARRCTNEDANQPLDQPERVLGPYALPELADSRRAP